MLSRFASSWTHVNIVLFRFRDEAAQLGSVYLLQPLSQAEATPGQEDVHPQIAARVAKLQHLNTTTNHPRSKKAESTERPEHQDWNVME